MVEAVARHGYGETTVSELVRLASVSKTTFYHHFESKEDCFLATLDTIVDDMTARVEVAYSAEVGSEERVAAGFAKFLEIICNETAAVSFVVVDSMSLGPVAQPHLEQAEQSFTRMLRRGFEPEMDGNAPSDLRLRAIVAGIRTVVYRCLREGHPEALGGYAETLRAWALCYRSEDEVHEPVDSARPPGLRRRRADRDEIDWQEPPDSERSRAELTQRERIVRATAQVAARVGYSRLTIPAISAAAGTSNQTFYEHFEGKTQAFAAAFQELSGRALHAVYSAAVTQSEWQPAVEAGLRGFLEYLAEEPLFARLAFFELPTVGTSTLDNIEGTVWRFGAFLEPQALPPDLTPLPPVIVEAIGGGIWAVIQYEIAAGRGESLPLLAEQIADIAFVPLKRRSAWPPQLPDMA
jgi:AcrR family transcriptional regulator